MQNSFKDLELEGWRARADAYDELFARITDQAINHILGGLGPLNRKTMLDVACGTGHLAGAAASRGAAVDGIDFASTMVKRSQTNFPDLVFKEGDAESLPYEDACFDAVACSFGLLHLEQPDKAVRESWRVLKKGGSYAFTVWSSPDQGGEFFDLVMGSINAHGTLDVPLPPAPPVFRFSDPVESEKVMAESGFVDVKIKPLPLTWETSKPTDILDLIYKSIVRMPMLLNAQTEEAREAIHRAIIDGIEKYRTGESIVMNFPALMATGRKP